MRAGVDKAVEFLSFRQNEDGTFADLTETDAGLKYLYDNGLDLKITGIIRPNEDATAAMMSGSIGYTAALTDYIATKGKETAALKAQLEKEDIDVFTGLPFKTEDMQEPTDKEKAADICLPLGMCFYRISQIQPSGAGTLPIWMPVRVSYSFWILGPKPA